MAWIQTIPWAEAGEELRRAIEAQRDLYPDEYKLPVEFPIGCGRERRFVPQSDSRCALPCVRYIRCVDVAQTTADTATSRDDHDRRLIRKSLFLLNCVSRRVSASNHLGR